MSLEENFKEKGEQENSILKKIVTGAVYIVVAATMATFLYFGIKYVCDNYLTEEKLEQMIPGPY